MGYEVVGPKSWAAEVAESGMERGAKFVCLLLALRLTQTGRFNLGDKNDWLPEIAREAGMSESQVEKRLEWAASSGYLTTARLRASDGSWIIREIRTSRPRPDGGVDAQVFVASGPDLMADIRSAMATDTLERQLQPTLLG